MRTSKEIKHDILQQKQEADFMLGSQFSFCVGGSMLTHSVTPEEYEKLMWDSTCGNNVLFGYSLVLTC